MDPAWDILEAELAHWPEPPAFWLRDDDAVAPAPRFAQLTDLCAHHDVPLCAAVIPAEAEDAFGRWLQAQPVRATVAVHGWAHENHAPASEKKAEFGDHRPSDDMTAELARGRARLAAAFGPLARPVFVPPWNRIGHRAAGALSVAGFSALSAMAPGAPDSVTGVTVANVHIDIIDWRGRRAFRGLQLALEDVCGRLADLRGRNKRGESTGILTHHAVHDAAAWAFLDALFTRTAGRVRWLTVDDVLAAAR